MANEVIKKNAKIIRKNLKDDGTFPNNADLPTLIYQSALDVSKNDPVFGEDGPMMKYWHL